MFRLVLLCMLLCASFGARSAETYLGGYITNVTFAGDAVLVQLNAGGLPTNCTGSPYGWMHVPASYKAMQTLVLGLWMRGDASQVYVTIYTDGLVNGYCQINQIDPAG